MRDRGTLAVWTAAFVVFAAVRIAAIAGEPVVISDDTHGYLHLSFVGHGRPWVVPLLYGLVSVEGFRVVAQCTIGIICWCALAYVAASVAERTWLRVVIAVGILVLGASPQVSRWDVALLSESLALSLTVAAIASWILFAKRVTTGRMVAVWVITLLWAFTRSAHLVLLPVLLALLAVSLAWRLDRRRRGVLLLAFVPVAVWGVISVRNDPGMTEFNTYSILDIRVFGNAERTQYFTDHGMPLNPAVLEYHGIVRRDSVPASLVRYARIPIGLKVPATVAAGGRPFVRWMRDEGPTTYVKWLVSHPGYTLVGPLDHLDDLVAPKFEKISPPFDSRAVLPSALTGLLYESYAAYLFAFAVALVSAIVAVVFRLSTRPLAVVWCLVGISVALLYIVWLGSAIEGARHAMIASVAGRIGILLTVAYTADRFLVARQKDAGAADRFLAASLGARASS